MVKKYKYTVIGTPPSNNVYMGRNKRWQYREEKAMWEWAVRGAVGRNAPKKPIEKSIVIIRYYFKQRRRRDPDNFTGKMILDGLVKSKVLEDDSFDHISLFLEGYRIDRKRPRTEIIIKEVSHELNIDWDEFTDVYIDYMKKKLKEA